MCTPCLSVYCAVASVLELDSLRVGQWMVSRPIVLGPILGWWQGDAGTGALMGVAVEVLSLDLLPLGGVVALNGTIATSAAVWLAVSTRSPGAALAGGLLLGWLFRWIEVAQRTLSNRLNADQEAGLQAGLPAHPTAALLTASGLQVLLSTAFLLLGLLLVEPLLLKIIRWPGSQGFETALSLVPLLGLVAFMDALKPRD